MYCINCGVKLADTEKKCPLCGTVVYHPDISRIEIDPLYPKKQRPVTQVNKFVALIIASLAFLLPVSITLFCDVHINSSVTWSGYVIGALIIAYDLFMLPLWFKKPNPVIFVPIAFAVIGVYLLYINLATGGDWFLSFAFPLVGGIGIIVTAVVTLLKYVRRGALYTIGGAFVALGAFAPVIEVLINHTFNLKHVLMWSFYPFVSLAFVGGVLIFFAICRPAREAMERRFFI